MKLKIKTSSWHYKLAKRFAWPETVANPLWYEDDAPLRKVNDDFCSYLRRVLLGVAVIGLLIALFLFYIYCNVLLFVSVFRGKFVFAGAPILQAVAVSVDGMLLLALVGLLLWKLWFDGGLGGLVEGWMCNLYDAHCEKRRAKGKVKMSKVERDPFYRAAYDTLKHKFCMKIEVTRE